MREKKSIMQNVDQLALGLYLALMVIGIFTVFAVSYDEDTSRFFNFSQTHGKQLIWMCISLVVGFSILTFDSGFFTKFAMIFYGITLLVLVVTYFVGEDINGARSWLKVGGFQFQPAEFGKTATALMLAKFFSMTVGQPRSFKNKIIAYLIFGIPMCIIIMQSDLGSALVYASLVVVVYREGFKINEVLLVVAIGLGFVLSLLYNHLTLIYFLSALLVLYVVMNTTRLIRKEQTRGIGFLILFICSITVLIISLQNKEYAIYGSAAGLLLLFFSYLLVRKQKNHPVWAPVIIYLLLGAFVTYGSDYIMNDVLKQYQAERVKVTLGIINDDSDLTYNITQSKMTIGSGGIAGKGYLNGTLTQSEQVPEQSTDFIFCTIGEEFGFLGTFVFLTIYLVFILRIIFIAERQRSPFSRVYAYCVASFFFLQIMINVGMTIGLIPVIGIPLPFISYGGSSVLAFSILVFIMLRLDADRLLILR
ncbi:MAG: rod shape-determining protein RodA [Chitinophagales bacterium]